MDKSQRLFLQCFMAKPFMSELDAKDAYTKCTELFEVNEHKNICIAGLIVRLATLLCGFTLGNFDPENFQRCINSTNNSLQPLFLEIRKGVSEDDGKQYYGLVNNSEDQISKLATSYTAHEVEYFRKVLDTFVQSDDGTATSIELHHAAADLPKSMNASHAEKLLDMWVKDNWLSKSSGNFWLGPRAVLELQPYLKRVYEDYVVDCNICMDVVLRGQSCVACDVKLHHHCAARYFKGRDVKKCPGCNVEWQHELDETLLQNEENNREVNQQSEPEPADSNRQRRKRARR